MILNLVIYKQQQFDAMAQKIMAEPAKYIDFNSVSDFYKVAWLKDFPQGTQVSATGLDDGAEEFYAVVQFKQQCLKFDIKESYSILSFQDMNGEIFKRIF
ncbi:hypothetical protein RFH95_13965 [Acinetobacter nosocomialis]|uniref:hypothetical protein n=1 Tax=Acinetobacter nosocomialis TaxID=106654 RepID=UPI000B3DE911|nr:hypothetical protein [Acinetobacter nosocomialis]MBD0445599.1 hypothetical protein [Acinetobacter nosocomialis]MDQ9041528.1 hypothetical protein [Acinetobacter nosocomialis]MDR9533308.1 hypothetical protein [Acinetobacter nosocomialis]OUT25445.1 hypothetical protein H125_16324 [Acinetobacter nosocomialis P020]PSE15391.1 hypothetical protein C7G95_09610 [Acinetobacter nosocomialis]